MGRRVLLLVALLALAALAFRPSTLAAAGPSVSDEGVTNRFPDGIEFRVSASGDRPIEKVSLRYTVLPDGTTARAVPDFEPGTRVSTSLTLAGGDADVYLPPGTRIRYHWDVEDADGDTASTPEATIVYEDVRFDWRKLEANGIVLHYYSGSEGDAQAMLDVARDAIAEMSGLLNAEVEVPVNVRIYSSVDDMRPALQRRSESYESQIITAGVRVSSDTVLVLGNVSFSTLRHELTHVVTAVAGEGPIGKLPAWLDEGTAVYGQGDPEGFGDAVGRAIDRGNVLSVRSITSYQGDPNKVDLFYGQSWALVSFLIDTYGQEKFAQLFAEIKSGKSTDAAMEAVYGFDQDGLDNEWRASVGLPPREGTGGGQEPSPTFPPSNGGNGSAREDDGGGASVGLVIGLAVAILAAAGAIAFATYVLARRFR
ncbi:MAG: peptidase MA family metallohydrolase [Dehalococcoidia bacterium]|nr:peptidase MA family metallohydrolase [Dehalococcoidia bacterium]